MPVALRDFASAEQLVRYLRRNRIIADLKIAELNGRSTGETVLAMAQSLGCDLLIKGAYTQSRLRQMIFGAERTGRCPA
jgi:nucleotide-binding universal stress UspA family protein